MDVFRGQPPAPTRIGEPLWSRADLLSELKAFHAVYLERPILDNHGGMSTAHLFALWCLLRFLKPKTVIESGVFQGQGTWLIERALPDAEVICIDIDWSKLKYRSKKASYLSKDFATQDWSELDKSKTFVFFDDHMNAVNRLFQCAKLGFRDVAFEDNYYPLDVGDVYSLKLAFANLGYRPGRDWRYWINRLRGIRHDVLVTANSHDSEKLRRVIEVYAEMPPVYLPSVSRWGKSFSELPTEPPLLTECHEPWQEVFLQEAKWYTWLAFVRLNGQSA